MNFASISTACALVMLAPAARAAEPAPQKTTLEAPSGEFWSVDNETFFVFSAVPGQRVTLTGTNLRIECDHLEFTTVGLAGKDGKDSKDGKDAVLPPLEKFKYLLATGQVKIMQGEREARAGRAEVFPREDKVELTENPIIIDHGGDTVRDGVVDHSNDHIGRGTKITMLRGERRVRIENSVFEAPAIKDLGFDPKEPVPGAKAPKKSAPQ